MKITRAKINGIVNPIGYEFRKIIASWNVEDTSSKKLKTGLIEVSKDEKFTEIVFSKESSKLDQTGEVIDLELLPRTRYFWRVRITGDMYDDATSDVQFFETGKMDEPWTGKWIAAKENEKYHPIFEKKLRLRENPVCARLYVSCLGVFEAYIDGVKVGNEVLTPYINDYETGMQIITFDVTDKLSAESTLDIQVAKGWYMSNFGLEKGHNFGDRMMAIAELWVTYNDGTSEVIGTDSGWKVLKNDVTESGIYYGEDLDRTAGTPDMGNAVEADGKRKLLDRYSIPVIVKEVIKAKEIIHTPLGETVIDFGQNHAGVMEFDADFPKGTVITVDCGEILQQGNFYNKNYREARSEFVYTSDGRKETVHPRFTFFGYRYIRINGWPETIELTLDKIRSNVIYSDMERTGFIETSNAKINRLYENCIWGQKSNFLDMPTDCPQRNERLGWTGDAQVFSQTASYNMDTRAFYRKFLRDLNYDSKRHGGAVASFIPNLDANLASVASIWGDVGTIMPDVLYKTFGSVSDVEEHYEMMKAWVLFMQKNDIEHGNTGSFILPFQYGDWLGLDGITEQSFKGGTNDDYLAACYYYHSTVLTKKMAERLGKSEDVKAFTGLAEKIKKGIFNEYFSPSGRLACDTQSAYIVALAFDIYIDRDKLIGQFTDRLRRDGYKIKCGFVGAPLLCVTLAKIGRMDLSYHFLFNEDFPGWLNCVNLGATTIWERWNSVLQDGTISGDGMNSLNHYSYGTIVQFMYEYVGGIMPKTAGFKKALIAPNPSVKFRFFNSEIITASGKYVSDWKIAEDGLFTLHVEIPFGAEAEVVLPRFSKNNSVSGSADSSAIGEDGEIIINAGIDVSKIGDDGKIILPAGTYELSYMPSSDYRCIYGPSTLLSEISGDDEIMDYLKKKAPKLWENVKKGDIETINNSLAELPFLFYLGVNPEMMKPINEKIYNTRRW